MNTEQTNTVEEDVINFINGHFKMVLSINVCGESPNASIMHYVMTKNDPKKIYFGTCTAFEKYKILKKEPRVSCIITEDGSDPVRAVSIHGVAKELDTEMEQELSQSIFKIYNKTKWYIEGRDDIAMFAIYPTSIRFLDGSSGELVVKEVKI